MNEKDSFNPDLYKYKMPNLFEFHTKEIIDNRNLKQLITKHKAPSVAKIPREKSQDIQEKSLPRNFAS